MALNFAKETAAKDERTLTRPGFFEDYSDPDDVNRFNQMKRYGSIIKVRPEKLEEYKRLHADVWQGVLFGTKTYKSCVEQYKIRS
jgi:hypothetical protein